MPCIGHFEGSGQWPQLDSGALWTLVQIGLAGRPWALDAPLRAACPLSWETCTKLARAETLARGLPQPHPARRSDPGSRPFMPGFVAEMLRDHVLTVLFACPKAECASATTGYGRYVDRGLASSRVRRLGSGRSNSHYYVFCTAVARMLCLLDRRTRATRQDTLPCYG